MLMRMHQPKLIDLKRIVLGIIQSSAFLGTNFFSLTMYGCILRNLLGCFYFPTLAFVPAFLASLTAIHLERPSRRSLLTLHGANLATETVWKMCETRGLVSSVPYGETIIFGVSMSLLLYLYRLGKHKEECKDEVFRILQIFIGPSEEGPAKKMNFMEDNGTLIIAPSGRNSYDISTRAGIIQTFLAFIEALKHKHHSCGHKQSCIRYFLIDGIKAFVGGLGLQLAHKVLLNFKKIIQHRMDWKKIFFEKNFLSLGIFLGGFSVLYKVRIM